MEKQGTPPSAVVEEVKELFCGPRAPQGHYRYMAGETGEIVIPDALYRFPLYDQDNRAVTLQVYKGINAIGGALWTREVRALLRVSSRGHPAIPTILGGSYLEDHDLAYVLTEAASYRLSDKGAMGYVAARPEEALRQLTLLAHGLSLLHEQGITHRNLQPNSIEYVQMEDGPEEGARYRLRLSRFEMSAMVNNLVRRQLAGERLPSGDLRRIYLDAPSSTLPYCPPERAEWLLSADEEAPFLESDRSDIYSLGVLAWRWLVEATGPQHRAYQDDQAAWSRLVPEMGAVRALHQHLRTRLRDPGILPSLRDVLGKMLSWEPRDRPSIFEVLRDLTQDYGRLVASLAEPEESHTYYVGFMPVESRQTIYKWEWIDQDPGEEQGREQLRAFMANELSTAELLYCPEGFSGFQKARNEKEANAFRAAKYVLMGKQAYWFCDIYFEPGPEYNRDDRRIDQLLLVKYVRHQGRAWRLSETPLRRRIPGEIKLIPIWSRRPLASPEVQSDGASWKPLCRSVEFEHPTPPWMQEMDDAMSFLADFRNAELDARIFPYTILKRTGTIVELTVDVARDRKRQYDDALRTTYFSKMRTPMGSLFAGLDGETTAPLSLYDDAGNRPDYRGGVAAKAIFERKLADDAIAVRLLKNAKDLPERGWLRPDQDVGSHRQLRNQEDAVQELMRSQTLLHQLHAPVAIKGIRARWAGVGDDLAGRSAEIVKDMLTHEPFYALHGPPGTGKTTVAKVAVAAQLRSDPSQRILVTSQSHYALDNLARRILEACKKDHLDVVAVRVASSHAVADEKVHPRLERYLPERHASATVKRIRQMADRALADDALPNGQALNGDMKAILSEWRETALKVELEIRDRIRRGANLVFATTGACTARNVATGGTRGLYDWVMVEEAARAWPSELAMPLVHGLRWTLIGDHFQLPAFDELSIMRFLQHCSDAEDDDIRLHGEKRKSYLESFHLFGSLFDQRAERRKARAPTSRLIEPLDELDLQFRMHPDICRVVSKAFYRIRVDPSSGDRTSYPDGWLRTHEEKTAVPHGLRSPGFIADRALVWLDTTGVEDSNDLRSWRNVGEAQLIKVLLDRMRPAPLQHERDEEEAFALLSPYKAQLDELSRLDLPSWTKGKLHTVDSFQGQEADIVVVSLVRSTQRDEHRPEANIGYLVSPNRVNVLLSRARKLLVIVGRLAHFERQVKDNPTRKDIAFWRTIAEELRRQDAVFSGLRLLGGQS